MSYVPLTPQPVVISPKAKDLADKIVQLVELVHENDPDLKWLEVHQAMHLSRARLQKHFRAGSPRAIAIVCVIAAIVTGGITAAAFKKTDTSLPVLIGALLAVLLLLVAAIIFFKSRPIEDKPTDDRTGS